MRRWKRTRGGNRLDTQTLIDEIVVDCEGLEVETAPMAKRRQARRNLAKIISDSETQRDFVFRRLTATITAAINDTFVLLPTTFAFFGKYGIISLGANQPSIEEKSLAELTQFQLDDPNRTGKIRFWALGGMDAATGRHVIQIWPKPDQTTTMYLAYMRRPPIPHDAADLDDPLPDELFLFPETWHDLVLYEGTAWRMMKDKASGQSLNEQRGIYEDGKRRMILQEDVLKSKPQTLAGFGSRLMGRRI